MSDFIVRRAAERVVALEAEVALLRRARTRTAARLRELRELREIVRSWRLNSETWQVECRAVGRERDELRAALERFTDLVEKTSVAYTAKYGATTYADAMDDAHQAARAALASATTPEEER